MNEAEETPPVIRADAEMNELLGLFDAPAFVRRGQDLEYALARLDAICRRERETMLEMVRLRLRQWASAARHDAWSETFLAPIEELWPLTAADPPAWADASAAIRRRHLIARDLIASVVRFNKRWARFLDQVNLERVNRAIEDYNRYYLLEKECCLGSARLAARHFEPKALLSAASLRAAYPSLPVPALATKDPRG